LIIVQQGLNKSGIISAPSTEPFYNFGTMTIVPLAFPLDRLFNNETPVFGRTTAVIFNRRQKYYLGGCLGLSDL